MEETLQNDALMTLRYIRDIQDRNLEKLHKEALDEQKEQSTKKSA